MIRTFKFLSTVAAAAAVVVTASAQAPAMDYRMINERAAEDYLIPVRPGYEGRNPFWNGYSRKFIYAPAFDFPAEKSAVEYRFTVRPADESDSRTWSFSADRPTESLAAVWNEIPVGDMLLTVEAIDRRGRVAAVVGEREFLRDFPFEGPYHDAVRPYREAARMALLAVHNMKSIRHWIDSTEPDMSYPHNSYPCKIIGATIRSEVLLARELPAYREQAEAVARNAAGFLIRMSRPEGEPLAFFPPTYYSDKVAARKAENRDKTMTMEAAVAAEALLDLYDLTGDVEYFSHASGIADTYVRLQAEDGSLPIKVDLLTGEPVNSACAMLHPLIKLFDRFDKQYGVKRYGEAQRRAEEWMLDVALARFDLTGQFEDVTVEGLHPYENLTNCTAAPYAAYLLGKEAPDDREVAEAFDLIRFSEDQFVFWNALPDADGIRRISTPCVFEQYKYRKPVDSSACNVAEAMLAAYRATGEEIYLAKAKALADNITVNQNAGTGQIATTWDLRKVDSVRTFWINCSLHSVKLLLQMDEILR